MIVYRLLECQPRIAILQMNDAAVAEAVFRQQGLHRLVVLVGVDAERVGMLEGKVENPAHYSVSLW